MIPSTQPPPSTQQSQFDPLRSLEPFPFRELFYPLGFAVEIETNSRQILLAAQESWGEHTSLSPAASTPLRLRLGVTPSEPNSSPPAVAVRAFGHLLSIIADTENFIVCDLLQGFAYGWVNGACTHNPAYLRYHFLEAAIMCLLVGSRATPIHAACISRRGLGFLLCGDSGAGKSTLAYACARAGFAFTSDDAIYMVWDSNRPIVRGNAHQLRFRPSARELFAELQGLSLTPRVEGKPSIVVRTSTLPGIVKAPEAAVHVILLLHRHDLDVVELHPLSREEAMSYLDGSLFPLDGVRERQVTALHLLRDIPIYQLRYRDLDTAIARLEQLSDEMTKR